MISRRSLSWRLHKLRRRAVGILASRLFRDSEKNFSSSVMLAGTARSGTTWLADLIRSQAPCRIMFEPFHSRKVEAYRQFNYFQYMRPSEDNGALLDFCGQVFSGEIRHNWIDREVDLFRPQFRLIKEIRANFLLGWIHARFPDIPLLLLIRHPCAVALSRMKLNWDTDGDIDPCLLQPKLVADFLEGKMDIIEGARTVEEKHAVIWCLHYLVPLRQLRRNQMVMIFYEQLCEEPEIEVSRVFDAIKQDYRDSVFRAIHRPSSTATRTSAIVTGSDLVTRWQAELSVAQIDRILRVVHGFGLDGLYGDSPRPAQVQF